MQQNLRKWLILAFFVFLPFEKRHVFYFINDLEVVAIYISDIIAGLLLLDLIFILFPIKHPTKAAKTDSHETSAKKSQNLLFIALFGFIIYATLRTTFLPHETNLKFSIFSIVKWLELGLLFIYFSLLDIKKYKSWILGSLIVSGFLQAIIAIAQFWKQGSLGLGFLGENIISPTIAGIAKIDTAGGKLIRAYGTFGHPNPLAAFLVVACATAVIVFLNRNDVRPNKSAFTKNIPYVLLLFLLMTGEAVTFSRAGLIALILTLAIIFLFAVKQKSNIQNFWEKSAAIFIALVLALITVGPYLNSRLTVSDQSTINRVYYDKLGLKIAENHSIFGVGLGQILPAISKIGNFAEAWKIQPPHNYFILVACETGIIGLAFIIFIFAKLLIAQAKKWGRSSFDVLLFAYFIAILLLMQFDHYFYTQQQTSLFLWAFLGIICSNVFGEMDSPIQ